MGEVHTGETQPHHASPPGETHTIRPVAALGTQTCSSCIWESLWQPPNSLRSSCKNITVWVQAASPLRETHQFEEGGEAHTSTECTNKFESLDGVKLKTLQWSGPGTLLNA